MIVLLKNLAHLSEPELPQVLGFTEGKQMTSDILGARMVQHSNRVPFGGISCFPDFYSLFSMQHT